MKPLLSSPCRWPSSSLSLRWPSPGWVPVGAECQTDRVRKQSSIKSASERVRERFLRYLWTRLGAVHDRVAAVEREGVLKLRQTFLCEFIAGVDHPPVGLRDNNNSTVGVHRLLHHEITLFASLWFEMSIAGTQRPPSVALNLNSFKFLNSWDVYLNN